MPSFRRSLFSVSLIDYSVSLAPSCLSFFPATAGLPHSPVLIRQKAARVLVVEDCTLTQHVICTLLRELTDDVTQVRRAVHAGRRGLE